jgi:hypothetical protein
VGSAPVASACTVEGMPLRAAAQAAARITPMPEDRLGP